MRFLLDQDVYAGTSRFLKQLGHDVVTASEIGLAKASDEELLRRASVDERIFITRDRDFGSLVFVNKIANGVLYLRVTPASLTGVHSQIERILSRFSETQLQQAFVVVTADGYRLRNIPAS